MRTYFSLSVFLLLISSFSVSAKANIDTIDNWQVYYNKKLVGRYNETTKDPQIVIVTNNIKLNDVLTIEYRNDAPCEDCVTGLYTPDGLFKKISLVKGKGTFNSLRLTMSKLSDLRNHLKKQSFNIYYTDGIRNKLLFKLVFKSR
jgi:hypothetical protein